MVLLFLTILTDHKENIHVGIKKRKIFQDVVKQFNLKKYKITYDDALRKWRNLLQTFRRYKSKNKQSGGGPVRWAYYDVSIKV